MKARRSRRELLPAPAQRAGHVELLFDVAFVYALAQTSAAMYAHLTPLGALRNLLLIAAFWLVWAHTTWATNLLNPGRPSTQVTIVLVMLGIALMGSAVPWAYADEGVIFALVYTAIQLGRTLTLAIVLRGQPIPPRPAPLFVWFALTGAVLIVGALISPTTQTVLWTGALGLTLLLSRLDFPFPGLGSAEIGKWKISSEHMAERYQQIIIVALGEKILSAGLVFGGYEFDAYRTGAYVASFATTILLWRIYFHRAGSLISETISETPRRARLTLAISYAHLAMFAGIMFSSAGDKIIINYADAPSPLMWVAVIVGGPALFLIGRERLHYLTAGSLARTRVIGLVVLAAMLPAMIMLEPVLIVIIVDVVLGAIVLSTIIPGRLPRKPTPPHIE